MLLQVPQLAHCPLHPDSTPRAMLSSVTAARRCRIRSASTSVADTAQLIEQNTKASSKDQLDIWARSQLPGAPAEPEMGSRVQIPRNKVLTTTMIAHATNKDINQVRRVKHADTAVTHGPTV